MRTTRAAGEMAHARAAFRVPLWWRPNVEQTSATGLIAGLWILISVAHRPTEEDMRTQNKWLRSSATIKRNKMSTI